jgi:hypothetical protein
MTDTLTTALQGHDRYFARVIESIPSDLYKHTVSEDADGAQEGKYAKVHQCLWKYRTGERYMSNK